MESTAEQRQFRALCLVLALVTMALYFRVTGYDYVYFDDPSYVLSNPLVPRGLTSAGISWALTTGHASNWHPLTWMSHMLDAQIYGTNHPGGHHFTNVLFHTANALLLFGLLRRMTGALWRSAVVAALFAWHPMHVESVAWISERKDVLSTFFGLLSLLCYAGYVREKNVPGARARNYYAGMLILFALGLTAKPMLVTLPFAMLLLDFWPLGRTPWCAVAGGNPSPAIGFWRPLLREKIPLFALSLMSSIVTFIVQKQGGAVLKVDVLPPSLRLANSLLAYAGYLRRLVWPVDLTIFYPLSPFEPLSAPVFAAAALLGAFTITAFLLGRRRPYVLFGWLWFLGIMVPVIGLVQVGSQALADRYSYLSYVGLFIIFAWGTADLLGGGRLNRMGAPWAIIAPVLAICAVLTWHQIGYWKNTETLFGHDLAVVRDNSVAHIALGNYFDTKGRGEEAKDQFLAALSLQPHSANILTGLGLHYAKQGDITNAIGYYSSAVADDPFYSDAHYNLGNVLAGQGKLAEAAEQYNEALRLKPFSPDAHNNLGAVYVRLGKLPEALAQFKEALQLLPDYPEAQDQMGGVFLKMGHPEVAQLHYEEAIRLKPDFAHAHVKLGLVLAEQNYLREAVPHFETAIKLEPTNADAYFNLAATFAALNRFNDAAQTFAEVVRQHPEDVDARTRLAEQLQRAGKPEAAVQSYREALRLRMDTPEALRGLAWIRATSANAELRDGVEAVRLAERADELTGHKQLLVMSALDAAYAEAGRFDDAIKIAEQVRQLAATQNRKEIADKVAQRLELYHAGRPFRE